jgi:hypothetical protein
MMVGPNTPLIFSIGLLGFVILFVVANWRRP